MTEPLEPSPIPYRTLLAAAKEVLDYREIANPALADYLLRTGHDHPLAGALTDLRQAVDLCERRAL
ncbi:hypothetical protein AB0H76_15265 [Nocardia sp. NPDC050712]|uniref:hypothetical protein n=1 Tax=Nocardia sp. NPDC050712 TaxID=3155518 RepID=UPI0034080B9E